MATILISTSLMLFSMFFGAGNLIFPPELGAEAGPEFLKAFVGFSMGGVILPILAVLAIAVSGTDMRDLVNRAGVVFGAVFSAAVYLSIGAFYALPRTGAVSFETAIVPVTGVTSAWASILFNTLFFGASMWLAVRPTGLVDKLGTVLTPALLILLTLLVTITLTTQDAATGTPAPQYVDAPFTTGLFQGYMTMDSAAALAFAIVVTTSLKAKGVTSERSLTRNTVFAAVIAGGLLLAIYAGLALIGRLTPAAEADGSRILTNAAAHSMGPAGQIVFGLIVLLACITTSTGLLAATSEFFERLLPFLKYRGWLTVFTLLSFVIASAGINTVLAIAVPIIITVYPICITVVAVTLFSTVIKRVVDCLWMFRLAAWTVAVFSVLDLAATYMPFIPRAIVDWAPLYGAGFGWLIPTVIAAVIGLGADLALSRRR